MNMKNSALFALSLLCFTFTSMGQGKKMYGVFENKTLFQIGIVESSDGSSVSGPIRFAPFANYTLQGHKDFSNTIGIYTGIGVKNVGFISKYNDTLYSEMRVKSRAYSISVPLGLKFGNMEEDRYFYVAGEFLAQIDYKEKVFIGDDKSKRKNDADINKINYSAIVGFNLKGFTIGAEYTLNNFYGDNYHLTPSKANPSYVYGTPSKSNILTFFIGFRTNLSAKEVSAPQKQLQQASLYQY
jgi:hypothetical protein